MITFQGKDGELRTADFGTGGTTYYLEVLFCEMDFTGPTSRPRTEETLRTDRGNFDTNAHYTESPDDPRYAPLPITFSCKLADTVNSRVVSDWFSGVTKIAGTTQLYTTKGTSTIDGNTLPAFADPTGKYAYNVEILWDGTSDLGYKYSEVHFAPGQQSITESADGLMMSINGQCYGDVTRITTFTAGYTSVI